MAYFVLNMETYEVKEVTEKIFPNTGLWDWCLDHDLLFIEADSPDLCLQYHKWWYCSRLNESYLNGVIAVRAPLTQ